MSSSRTYRATGINLKASPLGEADRLMTILTREEGLIRAVAKGARKQPSKLGGRMEPFVVNDLLLANGRWSSTQDPQAQLQRIAQAETVQSFPKLSHSLAKLVSAQYLAEVALTHALTGHSQEELFVLLVEHLHRVEVAQTDEAVLQTLIHGLYHLLALAGTAPQVQHCHYCLSLTQDLQQEAMYFSLAAGGLVCEPCTIAQRPQQLTVISPGVLQVLQILPSPRLPILDPSNSLGWQGAERLLRRAIEYHTEHEIRSASLVDSCWPSQESS